MSEVEVLELSSDVSELNFWIRYVKKMKGENSAGEELAKNDVEWLFLVRGIKVIAVETNLFLYQGYRIVRVKMAYVRVRHHTDNLCTIYPGTGMSHTKRQVNIVLQSIMWTGIKVRKRITVSTCNSLPQFRKLK